MKIDLTDLSDLWLLLSRNLIIGPDLFHNRVHRLLNVLEKRLGIDANPQRHNHQRHHVNPLANVEIRQTLVLRIIDRAEKHSLVKPKEISGVENDSERRPCRPNKIR